MWCTKMVEYIAYQQTTLEHTFSCNINYMLAQEQVDNTVYALQRP